VAGRICWRLNAQQRIDIHSADERWCGNNWRRHDFGKIREVSLMLGVKCDNRESVHGAKKESRFDAEHWVGRNTQTRSGGSAGASWRGRTLTTE
jgi:hypothetical protein